MAGEIAATWTLFEEPYWLDCVAPGGWDAVELKNDDRVIGRLPYVIKRRYSLRAISPPRFTAYLGPWIRPAGAKLSGELSHQHQVLTELIEALPRVQRTSIPCAPEFQNLMAFHWAGYHLEFSYTHRLILGEEQALWAGMRSTTRNRCQKAAKLTVINTERSFSDFISVWQKTYHRQGMDCSEAIPVLERVDDTMRSRNQCRLYCAENAKGQVHAAIYVIFDERHCFYLAGGGDPALRDSGAHAFAMWHAIIGANKHSRIFDFLGSMVEPIEHFVRGFGPQQVAKFWARRSSRAVTLFEAMASRRSHIRRA